MSCYTSCPPCQGCADLEVKVAQLRALCAKALKELNEHDFEYHYITTPELLEQLAIAAVEPPKDPA